MASEDDLVDRDGYVYQRNFDGSYTQKYDFYNQQPEKHSGDREAQPTSQLDDGTPLYRPSQTSETNGSNTSSGELEGILFLILVIAATIVFIGPFALGIWLYHQGWEKQETWKKRLWVVSWFASGIITAIFLGGASVFYFLCGVASIYIVSKSEEKALSNGSTSPDLPPAPQEKQVTQSDEKALSSKSAPPDPPLPPTPQENQILDLVSQGKSNQEIADQLGMLKFDIYFIVQRFVKQYRVETREQLIQKLLSDHKQRSPTQ